MLDTLPKRSAKRYAAPELTARDNLVEITRDSSVNGEYDLGLPPMDSAWPAGSVGFLL